MMLEISLMWLILQVSNCKYQLILDAEKKYVMVGDELKFGCAVDASANVLINNPLTWEKRRLDGSKLLISELLTVQQELASTYKVQLDTTENAMTFTLNFLRAIKEEDDGLYVCAMYSKKDNNRIAEKTINILVIQTVKRTEFKIANQTQTAAGAPSVAIRIKDGTYNVICKTQGSNPPAIVKIYLDNLELRGDPQVEDQNTSSNQPQRVYNVEKRVTKTIRSTDSNKTLKCVVQLKTDTTIIMQAELLFKLEVYNKLWFINQSVHKTLVGQEGKEMEIKCISFTPQYLTALKIEKNGTVKAIGDSQSVSYLLIPERTDHLSIYKCVDSVRSSITIKVKLNIRYAPVITGRLTNNAFQCDYDGFPAVYSVYRLDQLSKYGELVRSVNLNTEIFTFHTDPFPYQRNGIYTCVVSNSIPDIEGNVPQTLSTDVKYEGSPVFSPQNRNVKTGEAGQSVTMSFYIYSYPDVEQIFLEKIGLNSTQNQTIRYYNISEFTLRYTEYNNILGIDGYEILMESEVLDIDDFQTYRITAKNRLGKTNYYFEIVKNENPPLVKSKRTDFMILGIIGIILFVNMIIIHICIRVKHIQNRNQRHHNVGEDHNYHTYDEIGSVSYRAVRPMRSSDTNENQNQNQTEQLGVGISIELNRQSTIDNTVELNTEVSDVDLQQSDITDDQVQSIPIAVDDRNVVTTNLSHVQSTDLPSIEHILIRETSNDQHRQSSNDSDSESSQTVMVGNAGDGYENPYQTVFQDHPDSHQYNQATREGNNSISSADDNTTVIQSMQNIVNRNQTNESTNKESSSDEQSQISDDSDSGSFIYGMVGNLGEGYENPYQMILQDYAESHPYNRIMRARDNSNSSTESDKSEEQQIGTGSTKKEEYTNLKL